MKINQVLSLLSIFLLLGNSVASNLIITEIYIDGTDEYIELYNPGSDFSGSVLLEGAKSTTISLNEIFIPSQGFYLLGDNGEMLQGISLQKSGLSLNFIDTSTVNISLKDILGTTLDSFVLDATTVTEYDNKKTSFQKYLLNGFWTLGPVSGTQTMNAVAGFTINPGQIYSITVDPTPATTGNASGGTTGDMQAGTGNAGSNTGSTQGTGDTGTGNQSSGTGNASSTGDLSTGGNATGVNISEPTPQPQSSIIYIQEIHPGNDDHFKEYLELRFETAYSGTLRIIGAGHGSAEKTIMVSQLAKSRLLLGGEDFGFPSLSIDGLSLTDGGESLTIVGHDGQVLDSVVYQGRVKEKSLYRGGVGDGGVTKFDLIDIMTPGYGKEQILHLLPSTGGYTLPCAIDFQNRTPRYAGTSMNISALWNKEIISNSDTLYVCSRILGSGTILSNLCNPNYMQLTGAILDDLTLEIQYAGQQCRVTIPLNIPEKGSGGSSVSSSAGVNYYHEYQTWKEKFYELLKTVRLLGFDLSTSKLLSLDERVLTSSIMLTGNLYDNLSGGVSITRILPNPKGKDSLGESIQLMSYGTGIVSGLYLGYESKIFPIYPLNLAETTHLFATGFAFPNNGACVELKYGPQVLDSLCYPKSKEGEWYTDEGSETGSGVLLSGSFGMFSLRYTTKEICAYMDSTKILCEPVQLSSKDKKAFEKSLKTIEKQLSKKTKEIEKLSKKLAKQDIKIIKLTDKQKTLQEKSRELTIKYRQRREKKEATLLSVREKNSHYFHENNLNRDYIGFLEGLLYDERPQLSNSGFDTFMKTRVMYSLLEDGLEKNPKATTFLITPYLSGQSKDLLALGQGEVSEKLLETLYPPLYQDLLKNVDQIQKNISQIGERSQVVKLGKK